MNWPGIVKNAGLISPDGKRGIELATEPAKATIELRCNEPTSAPRIIVPGSKSITNRAFVIAALAKGKTEIRNPLVSDDTEAMLQCLGRLGVEIDKSDPRNVLVGVSRGTPSEGSRLFVGNAGTTARFLIAVAATIGQMVSFDGDRHMRKRPMGPILKAIESIGARHDSPHGNMPFDITGNPGLHAQWAREGHRPTVIVDASLSSQYTSALMMIAPTLPCGMNIRTESSGKIDAFGYIDITLQIMRGFGVSAKSPGPGSWDFEQQDYRAGKIEIEPDYSACTYFWAARVLGCKGLSIRGVKPGSTRQPDARALQVIETFPDMPSVIDGSQMQDSVPTLAVLAAFNNSPVRFTGIKNLRVKECDRIEAIATGLNRLSDGLAVVEGHDLVVNGSKTAVEAFGPACIDSHDDHRIAMAFALVALKAGRISITNPRCVAKTFPGFWDELEKCGAVEV